MKKSIFITKSAFAGDSLKVFETKFRSLEKNLEQGSRIFEVDDFNKTMQIEVADELDARRFAESKNLKSIKFCTEDGEFELNISLQKKSGRPRNAVFVNGSEKGMTVNQFKKYTAQELQKTHLTKTQVVKAKLLTKSKLEKYLASGTLNSIQHAGKEYVDREEVFRLMERT